MSLSVLLGKKKGKQGGFTPPKNYFSIPLYFNIFPTLSQLVAFVITLLLRKQKRREKETKKRQIIALLGVAAAAAAAATIAAAPACSAAEALAPWHQTARVLKSCNLLRSPSHLSNSHSTKYILPMYTDVIIL